ncbi:MAG: PQQ-binding-like beta-propeller repeat protein [Bryobacteraceae bacterium]
MHRALLLLPAITLFAQNWPQAAGPNGTWAMDTKTAPVRWSVARGENIAWKLPLPNGGQSGIAVWGDRAFLTTFAPGEKTFSASIMGIAVDLRKGTILWETPLEGVEKSPMLYAYSDSTTPSPVTDGRHVWFFNASGEVACFDFSGRAQWRRKFKPWGAPYPFNKQHEPILYGDVILNVEPLDPVPGDKQGWNYLHAIDKNTGKTRWVAADATTTYTTSRFGLRADGSPAVLTGRGGWHDVPERPVGLSLISLAKGSEGKTLWRFVAGDGDEQAPTWQSLYVLHWDPRYAYWFRLNPEESHLVIDARNGNLVREQSLIRGVDYRQWDAARGVHTVHRNVNLREVRDVSPRMKLAADEVIRVMPAWHANIVAGGYHYFLTSTAHRRNRKPPKGKAGPSHCIGRVNIETGKVEYLEVPVTVVRKPGAADERIYGVAVKTKTLNAEGVDVAAEERSRTDGWEIPAFWGSPVALGGRVYFTTMLGITYVVDATAAVLDEKALLAVNDLGASGETWSLNSISFAGGLIYHRTSRELIAIGQ